MTEVEVSELRYYVVIESDVCRLPTQYLKSNIIYIDIIEEVRDDIDVGPRTYTVYKKVDSQPDYGFTILLGLTKEDLTYLKLLDIGFSLQTADIFISTIHEAIVHGKSDLWCQDTLFCD